jgi:hypothetical protein
VRFRQIFLKRQDLIVLAINDDSYRWALFRRWLSVVLEKQVHGLIPWEPIEFIRHSPGALDEALDIDLLLLNPKLLLEKRAPEYFRLLRFHGLLLHQLPQQD